MKKDVDYEQLYYDAIYENRKLKNKITELEKENQELKETIISMSKFMFSRDNELVETIKNIDKSLKTILRRK